MVIPDFQSMDMPTLITSSDDKSGSVLVGIHAEDYGVTGRERGIALPLRYFLSTLQVPHSQCVVIRTEDHPAFGYRHHPTDMTLQDVPPLARREVPHPQRAVVRARDHLPLGYCHRHH